jgi:hypothetical protein
MVGLLLNDWSLITPRGKPREWFNPFGYIFFINLKLLFFTTDLNIAYICVLLEIIFAVFVAAIHILC